MYARGPLATAESEVLASITLSSMADTSYAPCGDLSLAYQVVGDGPVELVFVGPMVSHIELFWTMPEFKAFFDKLGTFCRIALFDKAGVGLSDPVPQVRTLDDRVSEIEAVMDAVGFEQAAIFGMSEGGSQAVYFAAKRPERTRALIVYGSFAYLVGGGWDEVLGNPAELSARLLRDLGEKYTPSAEQIMRLQDFTRAARSEWGSGATAKGMFPSVPSIRQLATFERMAASPGMARATMESNLHIDLRAVLPTLGVPTLVVHARDDAMPVQCGRYLRRPHPGRAVPRGRWRRSCAVVHRARHDSDRDRGVPYRWSCRAVAVTSGAAHRVVHRHRGFDATRRGSGR